MSSRNLMSVLLDSTKAGKNFSNSSNSLFGRSQQTLNTNKRARSSSDLRKANDNPSRVNSQWLPLLRVIHTLGVKLKKVNYQLFCRLESNMKHQRNKQKTIEASPFSTPTKTFDHSVAVFQTSLQNSVSKNIEPFQTCPSQIFLPEESPKRVSQIFKQRIVLGFDIISQALQGEINRRRTYFVQQLYEFEKLRLKIQMIQGSIAAPLTGVMKEAFEAFKNMKSKVVKTKRKVEVYRVPKDKKSLKRLKNIGLKSISEQGSCVEESQQQQRMSQQVLLERDYPLVFACTQSLQTNETAKRKATANFSKKPKTLPNHFYSYPVVIRPAETSIRLVHLKHLYPRESLDQQTSLILLKFPLKDSSETVNKLTHLYPQHQTVDIPDSNENFNLFRKLDPNVFLKTQFYSAQMEQDDEGTVQTDRQDSSASLIKIMQTIQGLQKSQSMRKSTQRIKIKKHHSNFSQTRIANPDRSQHRHRKTKHGSSSYGPSVFQKIEEMMIDLEKIKRRQARGLSQLHTPSKNIQSYCESVEFTNKINDFKQPSQFKKAGCLHSQRKNLSSHNSKENVQFESKIWHSKEKFLFYPQKSQKKCRKGIEKGCSKFVMSIENNVSAEKNYSLLTARKMQIEIDEIINRKNQNGKQLRYGGSEKKKLAHFY